MLHRHIEGQPFSKAAIDDIISRGSWNDWLELRDAAWLDSEIMAKIKAVATAAHRPGEQRYAVWINFCKQGVRDEPRQNPVMG